MPNNAEIKHLIDEFIHDNNRQEITGNVLNRVLKAMVDASGQGAGDVLVAVYNSTPYADIHEAYLAGKAIVLKDNDRFMLMDSIGVNNEYKFFGLGPDTMEEAVVFSDNVWDHTTTQAPYEKVANKILELTDLSTDAKYPSAKAVVDFVNSKVSGKMFIAEYGVTRFNTIVEAIEAGDRIVVCRNGAKMYSFVEKTSDSVVFSTTENGSVYSVTVSSTNTWTSEEVMQFITKAVNDLVNYYTKSETYTKAEVQALIGAIQQFHYEVYASISAVTDPASNVLYLIGPTGTGNDKYEEYVYDSTKPAAERWVKIGDTSIDLSGYATTEAMTAAINAALANYTTTESLTTLLAAKQDTISDLETIRSGAAAGATAYQKPAGGIPKLDLSEQVRNDIDGAVRSIPVAGITPPVDPAEFAAKEYVDQQDTVISGQVSQLEHEVDDLIKDTDADFAVADAQGNNIIECRNGGIKTKKFDSAKIIKDDETIYGDLSISDGERNILCRFSNGHIKTKFFDSSKLPIKAIRKAVFMGDSITQGVYSYWNGGIHTDENRYNGFDISDATSVQESTEYHGIHYYFGLFSGAEMVNLGKRGTGWVADTRHLGNALDVATNYSFSDVDFVALFFGVNDYIQGVRIGEIGTPDTVRGNMASVIQKIASDNPLCKIVVYSPYNTFGQVSKGGDYVASDTLYGDESTNYALGYDYKGKGTLSDYIAAIDDVCAYYGVQHIKLSASNVVNRLTIKNIMIDGLHPSKESYPMLAAEIYGKGNFGA